MNKLKVMTIVGTRPELIRLSRVMAVLDAETEHVLVHTGQNYAYELNEIFFDELGIARPRHFLEAVGASLEFFPESAAGPMNCPSALQLCQLAGDYGRLRSLARERGDLLAYAAAVIQER